MFSRQKTNTQYLSPSGFVCLVCLPPLWAVLQVSLKADSVFRVGWEGVLIKGVKILLDAVKVGIVSVNEMTNKLLNCKWSLLIHSEKTWSGPLASLLTGVYHRMRSLLHLSASDMGHCSFLQTIKYLNYNYYKKVFFLLFICNIINPIS